MNRGVDKRTIFLDDRDRARFVHDMYEFNDTERAVNMNRVFYKSAQSSSPNMRDVGRLSYNAREKQERIVDIHGWCLMSNHYHLLLSECVDGGISLFLKKLNGGYAKYFNERYDRSGALFQGKTKKVHVDTDAHFLHILNYIHLNPLDMLDGSRAWREGDIDNLKVAQDHLDTYRWSSYKDYVGNRNFPSILTTSLFKEVFNNDYGTELVRYMHDFQSETVSHLFLE